MERASILERILADTRRRLTLAPPNQGALEEAIEGLSDPVNAYNALRVPGIQIIAEVKRRSPSEGHIASAVDPVGTASTYEEAGAAAISVLTEPEHFGGSLEDLREVSRRVCIPTLRKDFIIDPIQLMEARAAGASMVLLIVAAMTPQRLEHLHQMAEILKLSVLVEAHTADEVRVALDCGARIVGVNNRDLSTFATDLQTCESLRPLIPDDLVAVAESGIHSKEDIRRLRNSGYASFLIGTALMRSDNPSHTLAEMLDA